MNCDNCTGDEFKMYREDMRGKDLKFHDCLVALCTNCLTWHVVAVDGELCTEKIEEMENRTRART